MQLALQTRHILWPPRPTTTTTTTITRDKRFLSLADWLMGLEIAFLLRVQTRIWVAFWQLILRWTTVYMLTGALSCFVSCGRKGRRKLLPCSAVVFFSCDILWSQFMPVKLFIKRHLRTWGVKSKWSLRRLQRYTTWPDVRFVQASLLDVSGRRQNCECVLAN